MHRRRKVKLAPLAAEVLEEKIMLSAVSTENLPATDVYEAISYFTNAIIDQNNGGNAAITTYYRQEARSRHYEEQSSLETFVIETANSTTQQTRMSHSEESVAEAAVAEITVTVEVAQDESTGDWLRTTTTDYSFQHKVDYERLQETVFQVYTKERKELSPNEWIVTLQEQGSDYLELEAYEYFLSVTGHDVTQERFLASQDWQSIIEASYGWQTVEEEKSIAVISQNQNWESTTNLYVVDAGIKGIISTRLERTSYANTEEVNQTQEYDLEADAKWEDNFAVSGTLVVHGNLQRNQKEEWQVERPEESYVAEQTAVSQDEEEETEELSFMADYEKPNASGLPVLGLIDSVFFSRPVGASVAVTNSHKPATFAGGFLMKLTLLNMFSNLLNSIFNF